MSREAWGDPPDREPDYCPVCGETHHTQGCPVYELDKRRIAAEDEVMRLRAALAEQAAEQARPDIIERLTYHALERDDLTLDDCLAYLAEGWKRVRGRTERQMVLQLTALLAGAPAAEQASAVQAVDALNTWHPVRLEFGVTMHRDHNPPSGGEWLKKDEVLAAVAGAAPAAEQAEPVAQTSAEWERRFLAYDPSSDPAEAECDIPPHGWRCTRAKGHDGPCAAVAAPDDVALVRRSMARLAAAEQAEPAVGFRLLPSRLTNEMRAAMADAARAYMARTGGNSPDAMYDAAVAAAPPAPARQEPMTSEQVKSIVRDAGYDHAPAQHRADFINGMRHAERAHGITAAPADGGAA